MSAAKRSRTEAGASGGARVFPKIKEVRAYVPGTNQSGDDQGADCHDVEHEHWINGFPTPIANPMSMYKQYQGTRKTWGINALGSLIVEVEAEDGTVGVGITIGGEPGCFIVENHLSRFCEGQDPRDVRATLCRFCRAAASLADPDGIAARSS